MPVENDDGKDGRHADPGGAPGEGFLKADGVRATMEDTQVERQHHQHEQIEENPE